MTLRNALQCAGESLYNAARRKKGMRASSIKHLVCSDRFPQIVQKAFQGNNNALLFVPNDLTPKPLPGQSMCYTYVESVNFGIA